MTKMEAKIKWRSLQGDSIENCVVDWHDDGVSITSEISGKDLNIHYEIRTDPHWLIQRCELRGLSGNFDQHFIFERDHNGKWTANGQPDIRFEGCYYIDISLTPFTNSLPINRLNLKENESREVSVVYFDFLEREVRPVSQRYTRVGADLFRYENIPNDFEADILVDANGFVVDYPGLFVRESFDNTVTPR